LFPIGFVSQFFATIGLRSPMHTAAIAHQHALSFPQIKMM